MKDELKKMPVTACLILVNLIVFLITDFTGGTENTVHMIACGAGYGPLITGAGEFHIWLIICWFCLSLDSAWSLQLEE